MKIENDRVGQPVLPPGALDADEPFDELEAGATVDWERAFALLPEGAAVLDAAGNCLAANAAFARMSARAAGDVVGRPWHLISNPLERGRAFAALVRCVEHGTAELELQGVTDGAERLHVTLVASEDGETVLCSARDITGCVETCQELRHYRFLADTARDGVLFLSEDGVILEVNAAAMAMYGTSGLAGHTVMELQEGSDLSWVAGAEAGRPLEMTHRRADGTLFPVEVTVQAPPAGSAAAFVLMVRDVTERHELERQLAHGAFHDALTGVANRALFTDRLQHALAASARRGAKIGVLYLDIDRFAAFNESLGHQAADRLLAAVAGRVKGCLRVEDTCSRYGGDEFALLLDPVRDEGETIRVANRILRRLNAPIELDGNEVFVSVSIGAAVSQPDETAEELLHRADQAMAEAKLNGKGRCAVATEQGIRTGPERLQLEADLHRAIEREEFAVYYQPIVLLETGRVISFEALTRWNHPRFGLMPPDEFVPIQEQIGLVDAFTAWVLETAQKQCRQFHDEGTRLGVAVNLSTVNVLDPRFPDRVEETLRKSGLAPSWLKLEITEAAVMQNPDRAMQVLTRLAQMGVRLSLDDFGTGFSSLAYLKQLPVHEIKVDKSFVLGMEQNDEDDTAIVRATIDLAHTLHKKVVAEGVESQETLELLKLLGCDAAQGYHMARPMPAQDLADWLRTSEWGIKPPA